VVRSVLQLQKDEMQVRSEPSTTPHIVQGDKVIVVTKNLFLRGQPNRKLRDRQFGSFIVGEQVGKHSYKLKLPTTVRLHPLFHALRHVVPVTVQEGNDEELYFVRISNVCIKSLLGRRDNYLLFMTH
jgi:hypothetical protein